MDQVQQVDFIMGRAVLDKESECLQFSFYNAGSLDISTVKVEGYCWRNDEYVSVRGCFTDTVPAQTKVLLQMSVEDVNLEPGKFFIREVLYSDSSLWQDPAGIFANYYIRQ